MEKKRKFLLVLPLLVLPFLAMIFWALGGGRAAGASDAGTSRGGMNMAIPGVNLKDDLAMDKLSYYDKSQTDSQRLQSRATRGDVFSDMEFKTGSFDGTRQANMDPNEEKVYRKINELNAAIAESAVPKEQSRNASRGAGQPSQRSSIDPYTMLAPRIVEQQDADPEMKQIEGMLDKILDIQNPSRVAAQLKEASAKKRGQVFAVTTEKQVQTVTNLDKQGASAMAASGGFYSIEQVEAEREQQNAIRTVVHGDQQVVNGATVKLRLLTDVFINGVLVPKDQFVYGTASLTGERLLIRISSIRFQQSLFPVELSVCDLDGIEGIHIPGAIARDVAKNSSDRGIQGIGINSFDPSLEMQAASVGIEAAKTFLSKKVKLVQVRLKAGYQVLLKDEKSR